ncbi:MAG: helix-turn-helix domain-containing protein [Chlamydiia bacterium]|nr:helix-turn-helix domain-containing protein [Chlamydiia bacterium]MCP5490153.1 helix-turn-helix domain-containing protein [Chlamydiales bacterium]
MSKMYEYLKQGLGEAIEHAKGKKTLRTKEVKLPKPPKEYRAKDIKALRKKLRCSQQVFAHILNVSVKTVQSWEIGQRHPNSTTNRLLEILESERKREEFFEAISA